MSNSINLQKSEIPSAGYVALEVKNDLAAVENGKPFSFFIKIEPASGIHVNASPPVSVKSLAAGMTMMVKKIHELGEWIDPSKPIEVEGKAASMNAGQHEVKLVVSYTYCSEEGRWCRFGNDTVAFRLKVKK